MIFHKPQKHRAAISLKHCDTVIEKVKDFNILGLIVKNEHLNWKLNTYKLLHIHPKGITP